MNALAHAGTTDRRFEGAGRVSGLGQACATMAGAPTTKTFDNDDEDAALPAYAGGAVGVWSDEPKRRANHKAKKHGRPAFRKWRRANKDRWAGVEL